MIKRYIKKDPFLNRESEKYPNPIPSREYIIDYLDDVGIAVSKKHLLRAFDLEDDEEKTEALRRRLRAMERDGQIMSNRRGKFALVKQLELVRGIVIGHREGYGFLVPDDGSNDLYLSSYQMRLVFPNDIVLARVAHVDQRGRKEGSIVEVLECNTHQVVGYYKEEGGVCFVEPENNAITQVILIPKEQAMDAISGQLVVAQLVAQPTIKRQATGRIIEILGTHMAPGLEIEVAIRSYELPYRWSESVLEEMKSIPHTVNEEDILDRTDLRSLPFVTIDGDDARDFDDAVFCQMIDEGWQLYVAIADVTHYLKLTMTLNQEAYERGNSVYFPDRVIPMLPEVLSNGICSLNPQVDRLSLVCELVIDFEGKLKRYQFYNAVIQSRARLTYNYVAELLQSSKTKAPFFNELKQLFKLYKKLLHQRSLRGALEFEKVETRIIFGENRKIDTIVPIVRNEAHRIIEECMLIANVAAADFLTRQEYPFLYRVHKNPDQEKLTNLRSFLRAVSLRLTGKINPTPLDYAKLIKKIQGRQDASVIQTLLLRSLKQAIYSPINEGHFGLAYDYYCHFTSPIRRFSDVITHRAIKHSLLKGSKASFAYTSEQLVTIGDHCSMTERRADEATRSAVLWLKCEYMLDKIGQVFPGIISEVTGFGIFVELKDIYVEGLVHITALTNDYYHFDPILRQLVGKRTHMTYGLGDAIQVKVVRVDLDRKQIDFDCVIKSHTKLKSKDKKKKIVKKKPRFS